VEDMVLGLMEVQQHQEEQQLLHLQQLLKVLE
jgi:hypothetical protein